MREITCYGGSRGFGWAQEIYETASRDAGRRAKELRKLGLAVTVSSMGPQVTSVGSVNMSLVNIRGDISIMPSVKRVNL